jgi:hypothetical protein
MLQHDHFAEPWLRGSASISAAGLQGLELFVDSKGTFQKI